MGDIIFSYFRHCVCMMSHCSGLLENNGTNKFGNTLSINIKPNIKHSLRITETNFTNIHVPVGNIPCSYFGLSVSLLLTSRSLIVGHFCENNAFYILLSWLPTYFHENFPTAKVSYVHQLLFSVLPSAWLTTWTQTGNGSRLAVQRIATEVYSDLGRTVFLQNFTFFISVHFRYL